MMDIKEVLLKYFINFFDKKIYGSSIKNEIISNKKIELDKPIIRNCQKKSKDSIWGGDLVDKHLTGKFNKGFRFL